MKIDKICILGGTGFIGSHLVTRLSNEGHTVRVLTRRPERSRHLLVMPRVELRTIDDFEIDTLTAQLADCQAVVNLVGILNGSPEAFHRVHAELPANIVAAAARSGTGRYLHMSALNADAAQGPSEYLKSKGAGEAAALAGAEHGTRVTCFRPSVVFGPGDGFFNRFAGLLKLSPFLPLACPNARFAPVYVGDVVEAFARTLNDPETVGQCYELCGPKVYTLRALVEYTAGLIGRRRLIFGLSDSLARLQARVFEKLPGQPFTTDNYLSLQVDSVCRSDGLGTLGIPPKSVESVMSRLFGKEGVSAQYSQFRRISRR